MAWNTTRTDATDWSAISHLNEFVGAINERERAIANIGAGDPSLLGNVAVGDDVQSAGFISGLQSRVEALAHLQFINGGLSSAGGLNFYAWNTPSLSAPHTYTLVKGTIINASGWTRKYPREFSNDASTTYTDGSAFANGHRARKIADGRVYDRTAGAWVLNATSHAPDTITAYGQFQAGDYIGPHLWNEMHDVLNALDTASRGAFNLAGSASAGSSKAGNTDPYQATMDDAKGDAQAAWSADGPHAETGQEPEMWCFYNVVGPTDFECFIFTRLATLTATLQAQYSSSVDFYAKASKPTQADVQEFDANGTGLVENQFHKFSTKSKGAASLTSTSDALGSHTQPTWPADTSQRVSRGFIIDPSVSPNTWVIEKFTGFTYKA